MDRLYFKCWIGGLRNEYYKNADYVICMFDLNSKLSCRNIEQWMDDVHGIPIIICGNKSNLPNKTHNLTNFKYHKISTKISENIENPFLVMAKQLTGYDDLKFI